MDFEGWGLQRWANHFNQLLNIANPPNRYKFDIGELAMETSRSLFPGDPIVAVKEEDLDGFAGRAGARRVANQMGYRLRDRAIARAAEVHDCS